MRSRPDYADVRLADGEEVVYRGTWPLGANLETVVVTTRRLIRLRYSGCPPEERSVLLRALSAVHDAQRVALDDSGHAPAVELEHAGGRLTVFPGSESDATAVYDAIIDACFASDRGDEDD